MNSKNINMGGKTPPLQSCHAVGARSSRPKNTPKFITLEGIEGAGKSTAIEFISKFLQSKNINFITTREPGGTIIAEKIRQIVLGHHPESMHHDTELLLFFAARAQHLNQVIKPALAKGKWVICDRFTDTSYAYQGVGRNIPKERIAILENLIQGTLRPDLTFILDIPPEVGVQRTKSKNPDRIEAEELGFFRKIRNCYLTMAKENPKRYKVIDAAKAIDEVERQINAVLEALFDASVVLDN
jgi:dTMP kinase